MSHTIAQTTVPALLPRHTVRVQAVWVLATTAQQWGISTLQHQPVAALSASPRAARSSTPLQHWGMAV